MLKIGHLCSKFWKTDVKFEIITFKIGYERNFVKIRKLIPFDPKCSKFGICAQNFGKQMSDLKRDVHTDFTKNFQDISRTFPGQNEKFPGQNNKTKSSLDVPSQHMSSQ